MVSSSGTSSGSSQLLNSGSDGDRGRAISDQRKQKRMQSNRESARRSRMRKQKHLDGLLEQVQELMKEKSLIHSSLVYISQQYSRVEAENSVLRTQMLELSTRLHSLGQLLHHMNLSTTSARHAAFLLDDSLGNDTLLEPWNMLAVNHPMLMMMDTSQYYY